MPGTSLSQLLSSEVARLAATRITNGQPGDSAAMAAQIDKMVREMRKMPPAAILRCLPEVENLAIAIEKLGLPFSFMLPLLCEIEKKAPGVIDTMPLLAERINHLRKAADISELFDSAKLERLAAALREYHEINL
ncbi:MAG: hypothetical protein BroJett021_34040 [Chloroflexota bacterium]|nr:MAG: hypothetical protein BroJett021_34040 [Chloroflexota bacterium]